MSYKQVNTNRKFLHIHLQGILYYSFDIGQDSENAMLLKKTLENIIDMEVTIDNDTLLLTFRKSIADSEKPVTSVTIKSNASKRRMYTCMGRTIRQLVLVRFSQTKIKDSVLQIYIQRCKKQIYVV